MKIKRCNLKLTIPKQNSVMTIVVVNSHNTKLIISKRKWFRWQHFDYHLYIRFDLLFAAGDTLFSIEPAFWHAADLSKPLLAGTICQHSSYFINHRSISYVSSNHRIIASLYHIIFHQIFVKMFKTSFAILPPSFQTLLKCCTACSCLKGWFT